jgi:hypothetical protein
MLAKLMEQALPKAGFDVTVGHDCTAASFAGNSTQEVFNGTRLLASITLSNAVGGCDFIAVVSTKLTHP